MKLDRGHGERGGGDGRDCKSKRDRKARNSDNEVVPFSSHALIMAARSVPRSPPTTIQPHG
jgi:hypothetical protein